MATKTRSENKKEVKKNILDTAEKVFASQGYDGASMDTISKEAGVNKALIYYYYGSKLNLLIQLVRRFSKDRKEMVTKLISELEGASQEEFILKFVEERYDFFKEQKQILQVLIMESLKHSQSHPRILKAMVKEINNFFNILKEKGIEAKQPTFAVFFFFYFMNMPMINFVIFEDHFPGLLNISREELSGYFKTIDKDLLSYFIQNHMKNQDQKPS